MTDTIASLRARLAAAEQRDSIRRAALEMIAGSLTNVMSDQFQNWLASYALPASGDNPTFPGMKRALVLPDVPIPPGAWVLPEGIRAQLDRDAETFGAGYARIRRSEEDPETAVAERLPPSEVVVVKRAATAGPRVDPSFLPPRVLPTLPAAKATTRSCTCLGTCRGADGLADGWRCAEGNDPVTQLVASLASAGRVIDRSTAAAWTAEQRRDAYAWVVRTKMAATGRDVEAPVEPLHVLLATARLAITRNVFNACDDPEWGPWEDQDHRETWCAAVERVVVAAYGPTNGAPLPAFVRQVLCGETLGWADKADEERFVRSGLGEALRVVGTKGAMMPTEV